MTSHGKFASLPAWRWGELHGTYVGDGEFILIKRLSENNMPYTSLNSSSRFSGVFVLSQCQSYTDCNSNETRDRWGLGNSMRAQMEDVAEIYAQPVEAMRCLARSIAEHGAARTGPSRCSTGMCPPG